MIASEVRPPHCILAPLALATGRVLAEPILAHEDSPAFDKAVMDGFAVRSADCTQIGDSLTIVDSVAAGAPSATVFAPGQAMRINTGAPMPTGADAVVRIEDTDVSPDDRHVTIRITARPGMSVAKHGSICHRGEMVLAPPLRLGAAQLAAAVAAGTSEFAIYPEVTVSIAVTGDELVPAGGSLRPGQIHESNGPMLAALVRQFGAIPHDFGIVRDDRAALQEKLGEALRHPVVITAGGMSMGTLDLVPQVFTDLGVRWLFHGINMRPGKPIAYGRGPNGQHVFGLPGNPASAFVCSWLFARAVIRGLQGFPPAPPHRWRATLTHALTAAKDPRPSFVPATVWNDDTQGLMVEPCTWSGSGDPFGLALANALLVCEIPTQAQPAGSTAEVIYTSTEI